MNGDARPAVLSTRRGILGPGSQNAAGLDQGRRTDTLKYIQHECVLRAVRFGDGLAAPAPLRSPRTFDTRGSQGTYRRPSASLRLKYIHVVHTKWTTWTRIGAFRARTAGFQRRMCVYGLSLVCPCQSRCRLCIATCIVPVKLQNCTTRSSKHSDSRVLMMKALLEHTPQRGVRNGTRAGGFLG